MVTDLVIDDEADREIGHHATQVAAIEEYIQHCKRLEILDHFGTVDFDSEYDYKANRMSDKIQLAQGNLSRRIIYFPESCVSCSS